MIGSGLDVEGFIVIVVTGVPQAFVLHVPYGMCSLLGCSWLTYPCAVHRNEVAIWSSRSQNVWLGSPAGGCQGLSALQYAAVGRSGSWTKSSSCSPCPILLIAFTWTLQAESQPLPFLPFHRKGLCIQESTFFPPLLPVVLVAAFNKANGKLLVHLTSP